MTEGTPLNVLKPLQNFAQRYLDGLMSRAEFLYAVANFTVTDVIKTEQATVYLAKTLAEGRYGVDQ